MNITLNENHYLYIQSDTLLLADVKYLKLSKWRRWNMWIWSSSFSLITRTGISSTIKKRGVELELLTDVDMLLIVEKGIGGEMCQGINQYPKANNKFMRVYDQNKESRYDVLGYKQSIRMGNVAKITC